MTESPAYSKKVFKFFLRIFLGLFLLLLLSAAVIWYAATSDSSRIKETIAELIEKDLGTAAGLSHYSVSRTDYFPFLSIRLEDVFLEGSGYKNHQRELLRINELSFLIHPFDLLKKNYTIRKAVADSVYLKIYKDSSGIANTLFLKSQDQEKGEESDSEPGNLDLERIRINYLDVDLTNDKKSKYTRFSLTSSLFQLSEEDGSYHVQLETDCTFKGLLHEKGKGAFLENQSGHLQTELAIDPKSKEIRFLPSVFTVNQQEVQLEGLLGLRDTSFLKLRIHTDGMKLEDARHILNAKTNHSLREIRIDQKVRATVLIEGGINTGHPIPIRVDFSSQAAAFHFQHHQFTRLSFAGSFENHCQSSGKPVEKLGCLNIETMNGLYMGNIPVRAQWSMRDIGHLGYLRAEAHANATVERWKAFFGEIPDLVIDKGEAGLYFKFEGDPVNFFDQQSEQQRYDLTGRISLEDMGADFGKKLSFRHLSGQLNFDNNDLRLDSLQLIVNKESGRISGAFRNAVPVFMGKKGRLIADLGFFAKEVRISDFLVSDTLSLAPAALKDRLLLSNELEEWASKITRLFDLRLGIRTDTVHYQNWKAADFDFQLEVNRNCKSGNLLTEGNCLKVNKLKAILLDEIPLNASFVLNDLSKPMLELQLEGELPLKYIKSLLSKNQINLNSGFAALKLKATTSLNNLTNKDSLLKHLQIDGALKLKELTGSFGAKDNHFENLYSDLHFNEEELDIERLNFSYDHLDIAISGQVKDFRNAILSTAVKPELDLKVAVQKIDLSKPLKTEGTNGSTQPAEKESTWLPSGMLALVDSLTKQVTGKSRVMVEELLIPDYEMKKVDFLLQWSGPEEGMKTKGIRINDFQAEIWGNTAVKGEIAIDDLDMPEVVMALKLQLPVEEMRRLIPTRWLRFKDGLAELDLRYRTKLSDSINLTNYLLQADLEGSLELISAEIDYTAREFMFNNINGKVEFNNQLIRTDGIDMVLNNNPLHFSGSCTDYLQFFVIPDQKIQFDINLNAPVFDFDYFRTPKDLGLSKDTTTTKPSTTDKFEDLLNTGTMRLTTNIEQLIYRQFRPTDITGTIDLSATNVKLENVGMSLADGTFAIEGEISDIEKHNPKANVEAQFIKNDISDVFFSFDNFGQKDMTFENIRGYFSATIRFRSSLNDDYKVVPSTIKGQMDLSVQEGELLNLPAFEDLGGILFNNRRMHDISFDALSTTTYLNGLDLIVDYFFIHSTSLDFGVVGRYSLGTRDRTYMLFEVPTGNIFRKYIPKEELDVHKKRRGGFPIYIEAKEKNNDLTFKVRLFKRKKKLRKVMSGIEDRK